MRSRLRSHDVGSRDFIDFVLIEDELNEFLSALTPLSAMLRRLLLGRHITLEPQAEQAIEDLLLSNEQLIEGSSGNVKSIVNIRQAYATIASNNLNRTMKILTGATVLIALPTMLFSFYGMNLQLPFMEHDLASLLVILAAVFLTIMIALVAHIKRVL
jgi:magnesium transporter